MFKKDNSYLLDYTRQIDRRVNDLNDLSTISKKELDIIIVTISAINQERKDNESKINTIIDLIQNIKSNFEISVKKKMTEIEQKISNNDTEILNKKITEMEQKISNNDTEILNKKITEMEQKISNNDTEILNKKIKEMEQKISNNDTEILNKKIKEMEQKISNNDTEILNKKITEIEQKISNNDTEILNKKIKEMEQKISNNDTEILNKKIKEIEQKISNNDTEILNKKIKEMEQKISNNDTEILNKKIKEMEQKKDYKNNLEKIHMIEIPNNLNDVKFPKIILNKGTYFIDLTLTFINNNIVNDASVIIDLIAKTDNKNILIGRSSHTWYGRFNGDDIYHGYQTVIINGILDIDNATNVDFYTKSIDQRHCSIVAYVKEYPALLRIY
jgi:hypothetical protein